MNQGELRFGGSTYEPAYDYYRLESELSAVYHIMKDGQWRTLNEIKAACAGWPYSIAGISARLRDFRKVKFGKHTVNRRRRGEPSNGLFEYQLII